MREIQRIRVGNGEDGSGHGHEDEHGEEGHAHPSDGAEALDRYGIPSS
jgi:hypothetical protein